LDLDQKFDQVSVQNYSKAKRMLTEQSEWLSINSNSGLEWIYFVNIGNDHYRCLRLDSASFYYNLATKSPQIDAREKQIIFIKQFLINEKQLKIENDKLQNADELDVYDAVLLKLKVLKINNEIDSALNLIEKTDLKLFEDDIIQLEFIRESLDVLTKDQIDVGINRVSKLLVDGSLNLNAYSVANLLCLKAFYQSIELETEDALSSLQEAESHSDYPSIQMEIKMQKAYAAKRAERYEEAIGMYSSALNYHDELGLFYEKIRPLYYLGSTYSAADEHKKSLIVLKQALAIDSEVPEYNKSVSIYLMLGYSYKNLGKFKESKEILTKGIRLCKKYDHLDQLQWHYHFIGMAHHGLGELDSAYNYQVKRAELLIAIQKHKKRARVDYVLGELKYQDVINENQDLKELHYLKDQEIERKNQRIALLIGMAILLILGIIFLVVFLRMKNQLFKSRQRELSQKVMSSNRLIEDQNKLINQLQIISKEVPVANDMITKLINDIRENKDWVQFSHEFKLIHPDFIDQMTERFEKLTDNDLRLACLIKLEFGSHEIAELSNITFRSVMKARQRMRKKMGIDTAVDLEQFIRRID
jgi:tetratricopeptide (TPR) repeat protein